jgi:putative toxin-antitoxin system antitoxin component (TIGR02293 family)
MLAIEAIVSLWGGSRALGRRVRSDNDLIPLLRQGLPYAALERTREAFGLSRDEIATVLDLPLRTLTRRRQAQRLAADESDRLYRLTRIMTHAEQVFHDRTKAAEWLHRPNRALQGEKPLTLLDTDVGASQVDDVLGRLEHGVFS